MSSSQHDIVMLLNSYIGSVGHSRAFVIFASASIVSLTLYSLVLISTAWTRVVYVVASFCSVMVDASSYNFLFYEGGVFSDENCGSDETNLSHAMLLVGYVDYTAAESSYWIIKNR